MRRRSGLLLLALLAACPSTPADPVVFDAASANSDGAMVDAPIGSGAPDARTLDAPSSIAGDAGTGGSDGGSLIFDPCVANPRPGYEPTGLTPCCGAIGPAHCVPSTQIPVSLASFLSDCVGGGECMPDPIIRAGGQYQPPSCTSTVVQAPGACLSKCIPLIADNPLTPLLRQDGCGDGEVCAPCTNPLDQTPTGACNFVELLCPAPPDAGVGGADATTGGDGGSSPDGGASCPHTGPPIIDPSTLAPCAPVCGGAHCVPAQLVPAAQQPLLASCTAQGNLPGLCAPDLLISTGGNFVPRSCTSVAGAEGRCLSNCLPDVAEQAPLLPRDVCAVSEECVPCYDPTSNQPTTATGACNLACDQPTRPPVILSCPWTGPAVVDPVTLPQCGPSCNGAHCVPGALVPAALQPLLATCATGFCAPDPLIRSGAQTPPASCRSVAGVEGRCLSTCLPEVADRIDLLPLDSCVPTERCVPCFDPTSQEPTAATGACTIACDHAVEPPLELDCPWTGPPVLDASRFPACSPICGGAHCVPGDLVPGDLQGLLAECSGGFCTPDPFISTAGNFIPQSCSSVAGAEGRCLSTCLPDVAARADLLPTDVCGVDQRCVPCFDPTSGDPTAATGACSISCDTPMNPPVVLSCPWVGPPVVDADIFPACDPACGGAHCVPAAFIPDDQRGLLAACPGGFCAPDPVIAAANNWVPKSCRSIAGAEGRCLSTCLPLVAALAQFLPNNGCGLGQECAPCFDPTSADPTAPTGACSIACDAPKEPPLELMCPYTGTAVIDPTLLPACAPACGGSHCLPAMFVPIDRRDLLAPCAGGFCTPDPMIQTADNWNPPSCTSIAGAEGRCLSTCLPVVASQTLLPQSTCAPGNKCVPCYDPTASNPRAPTGACGLGCDAPKQPPTVLMCPWNGPAVIDPQRLPECAPQCPGARCLPAQYVPADQRGLLAPCSGGFCTPDPFIESAGYGIQPSCTAFAGTSAEGRCLSECLPIVAQQATLEQGSCTQDERCAPCYDPLSGAATGACDISCDQPHDAPYHFPPCCSDGSSYGGTCVVKSQVPDDQESQLSQDVCPNANFVCVPAEFLPGGHGQGCSTVFYSGTCISNCVDLGIGSIFPQSDCPNNHTCIPCDFAPGGSPGC